MRLNILLQIFKLLLNIFAFQIEIWQAGDNLVTAFYTARYIILLFQLFFAKCNSFLNYNSSTIKDGLPSEKKTSFN